MELKIIVLSVVIVALAVGGLLISFYNKKNTPSCSCLKSDPELGEEGCNVCGTGEMEDCRKDYRK